MLRVVFVVPLLVIAALALAVPSLERTTIRHTPQWRDEAAANVQRSHDALLRWLGRHPNGIGWTEHLDSDGLQRELSAGEDADVEVVRRILGLYAGPHRGLEERRFVAVRLALRDWASALTVAKEHEIASLNDNEAIASSASHDASPAHAHPPDWDHPPMHQASAAVERLPAPRFRERPATSHRGQQRSVESFVASPGTEAFWHSDYFQAAAAARAQHKLLFIHFYAPGHEAACEAFDREIQLYLTAVHVRHRYVWLRLSTDSQVSVEGRSFPILHHPAFAEMHGRPGIAMIDYENPNTSHYGYVVSQFPFAGHWHFSGRGLQTILELPPGTLTQRTLIYAVRSHPHAPRSAGGLPNHILMSEAEAHSRHQASIASQGHHGWEGRFHQINARLGGGQAAREVVAESWPNQSLVAAALECVDCWRQSGGHWDAVSGAHAEYGYDMQRAGNGVWYATGLFGG
jgi:hypothetical protein